MSQTVSWIHFGDLHISNQGDRNHLDFLALIEEANRFGQGIAFGLLPGDNADDGEEDQYACVKEALSRSRFPIHAIAGDHDVEGGSLDLFRTYLSDQLHRSFTTSGTHFVLLNSVSYWKAPVFGLGSDQMAWLREDLAAAVRNGKHVVVFMHAYPSEHEGEAGELAEIFRERGVLLVEMGHTHYNELANDGQVIYAATRSTGQIEEGPPGFSIGTIDDGVVSWKFKPLGETSIVMITSPSDERLIVNPSSSAQLVRGMIAVRARVWGEEIETVMMTIARISLPLQAIGEGCLWKGDLDSKVIPDGSHELDVTATTSDGKAFSDRVRILINQRGQYNQPARQPVDYENAVGEWPEKHVLGTQLGPNENGRDWQSRHAAERQSK